MWLFSSPKDYSEMVEKISKSIFVILIILLYLFSQINDGFNSAMLKLSFGAEYEIFGLKLNLALIYFPLLMGIFEHMFKIHDLFSDLLGIRKRYDRFVIVATIFEKAHFKYSIKDVSDHHVQTIMSRCFYKYASSGKPEIDPHSITLTLNEWCWFWILLDTLVSVIIASVAFLIISWSWLNLAFVLACIVVIVILMWLVLKVTKKYTCQELAAIFSDTGRAEDIKKVLTDALPNE